MTNRKEEKKVTETKLEEEIIMNEQTEGMAVAVEPEVKVGVLSKAKAFVKTHKLTIGATAAGILLGVAVTNKLSSPKAAEREILEADYDEVLNEFAYDAGYETEQEKEAE